MRQTAFSRRCFLAATAGTAIQAADPNVADVLKINDLDRRVWQGELNTFVPNRIFDLHCHITRLEFNLDLKSREAAHPLRKAGSLEALERCDTLLYPNRTVSRMLMPSAHAKCDFDAQNEFIAAEARKRPGTPALMLIHPKMSADDVDSRVRRHRFVGFKGYRWYSITGDVNECGITDFFPEHLIAVANRYGLMIMLHVAKKAAIADPQNLTDLERLTAKYPRVRWVLAHCARSYSDWAMTVAGAEAEKDTEYLG